MKNLSKIQRKFLKYLIKDTSNSVSILMENKFFSFFAKNYPDYSIKITKNLKISIKCKVESPTDKTNKIKRDIIDVLVLLKTLVTKEYIFLYEKKKLERVESEKNFDREIYEFQFSEDIIYFTVLTSNYSISSSLNEFIGFVLGFRFNTSEQRQNKINFWLALSALIVSIVVGIESIKAQYDIARHINTVVEFPKDTKLIIENKTTK